jgi:hypothetical protein
VRAPAVACRFRLSPTTLPCTAYRRSRTGRTTAGRSGRSTSRWRYGRTVCRYAWCTSGVLIGRHIASCVDCKARQPALACTPQQPCFWPLCAFMITHLHAFHATQAYTTLFTWHLTVLLLPPSRRRSSTA